MRSVNFSRDGRHLITASDDKTVKLWSLPSQRFTATLSGHMNWVRSAEFSPDGRLAVSGGDDKTMRVWDVTAKRCLRLYDDHAGMVNTVKFHPDGTCIASAGTDNVIKVWDIRYAVACTRGFCACGLYGIIKTRGKLAERCGVCVNVCAASGRLQFA